MLTLPVLLRRAFCGTWFVFFLLNAIKQWIAWRRDSQRVWHALGSSQFRVSLLLVWLTGPKAASPLLDRGLHGSVYNSTFGSQVLEGHGAESRKPQTEAIRKVRVSHGWPRPPRAGYTLSRPQMQPQIQPPQMRSPLLSRAFASMNVGVLSKKPWQLMLMMLVGVLRF